MTGGALVKEKREARGLLQEDLAAACDTSVATISRFERGISTPHPATLAAIAAVLKINASLLLPSPPAEELG